MRQHMRSDINQRNAKAIGERGRGDCEMNRFENHFLNSLIAFRVVVVVVF